MSVIGGVASAASSLLMRNRPSGRHVVLPARCMVGTASPAHEHQTTWPAFPARKPSPLIVIGAAIISPAGIDEEQLLAVGTPHRIDASGMSIPAIAAARLHVPERHRRERTDVTPRTRPTRPTRRPSIARPVKTGPRLPGRGCSNPRACDPRHRQHPDVEPVLRHRCTHTADTGRPPTSSLGNAPASTSCSNSSPPAPLASFLVKGENVRCGSMQT